VRQKARIAAGIVGTLLAAGVVEGAPLAGFVLTAQTQHFTFYSRDNRKIDARRTETYLLQVERLLGQRLSGRADYYRYSSAEELAAGTGTYATGLTYAHEAQIHSTRDFHAHEIVHLVAGQMGDPGAFFQEGLAVAVGNRATWQGVDVDKTARKALKGSSLRAFVDGFESLDPRAAYAVAGSFVNHLVRTRGITRVAEFFRACRPGSKMPDAFARTFGQSLDEAGAAWAAGL